MKTGASRSLGAAITLASLVVAIGLYVLGTPLLSSQRSDVSSGGAALVFTINVAGDSGPGRVVLVHWPLIAVGICVALGGLIFLWPRGKPPRLQG